jgi:hypothetical protein
MTVIRHAKRRGATHQPSKTWWRLSTASRHGEPIRHQRKQGRLPVWRGAGEVMQNRSNRRWGKPVWVRVQHQPALMIGAPAQADCIGASGTRRRINRPDT